MIDIDALLDGRLINTAQATAIANLAELVSGGPGAGEPIFAIDFSGRPLGHNEIRILAGAAPAMLLCHVIDSHGVTRAEAPTEELARGDGKMQYQLTLIAEGRKIAVTNYSSRQHRLAAFVGWLIANGRGEYIDEAMHSEVPDYVTGVTIMEILGEPDPDAALLHMHDVHGLPGTAPVLVDGRTPGFEIATIFPPNDDNTVDWTAMSANVVTPETFPAARLIDPELTRLTFELKVAETHLADLPDNADAATAIAAAEVCADKSDALQKHLFAQLGIDRKWSDRPKYLERLFERLHHNATTPGGGPTTFYGELHD